MPIYTVEKEGLQWSKLGAFGNRNTYMYVSQTAIPKLYLDTRDIVMAELGQIHAFSATADVWSSCTIELYVSFTVYFIDSELSLRMQCQQCGCEARIESVNNIATACALTLEFWNFSAEKLVCISNTLLLPALQQWFPTIVVFFCTRTCRCFVFKSVGIKLLHWRMHVCAWYRHPCTF